LQRRVVHYSGHVQGVGFRYSTQHIARRYDVKGYVRNQADGRVELVLEGDSAEIDAMLNEVAERMQSYIRDIRVDTADATGEFNGFSIRY
jgi:acylphosphatase